MGFGIAIGLPRNVFSQGLARPHTAQFAGIADPEAILAGSCSGATRDQIGLHAQNHSVFSVDIAGVVDGRVTAKELEEMAKLLVALRGMKVRLLSEANVDELTRVFGKA